MTDTIERPRTDKITAPAKAWRNRWRVLQSALCRDDGKWCRAGHTYWGTREWPSKDAAETAAAHELARMQFERVKQEYLGAFPVTP